MLKDSVEYKDKIRKTYNKQVSISHKNFFSFEIWRDAFEAGFDAARSHEEYERLKAEARKELLA